MGFYYIYIVIGLKKKVVTPSLITRWSPPVVSQIREFLRGLHGVVAEDKAGWDAMAGVDDLLTKGIYRIESNNFPEGIVLLGKLFGT